MISCSEAVEQLWAYLEQELDRTRRADIERHLAFCRRCCGELEFARVLQGFLADAARPALPSDVEGRLTSFLEALDARQLDARQLDARQLDDAHLDEVRLDDRRDVGEVEPT